MSPEVILALEKMRQVPEEKWGEIRPGYKWGSREVVSGQYYRDPGARKFVYARCECGNVSQVLTDKILKGKLGACKSCSMLIKAVRLAEMNRAGRVGTLAVNNTKKCCTCKERKPASDFILSREGKTVLILDARNVLVRNLSLGIMGKR